MSVPTGPDWKVANASGLSRLTTSTFMNAASAGVSGNGRPRTVRSWLRGST
jgi:hypothetical protein